LDDTKPLALKVLNIHKRIIYQPQSNIVELIKTLSRENDKVWPKEQWPRMKFNEPIKVGVVGGHGPIGYVVEQYDPDKIIQFRFLKPKGFYGIHKFEIESLNPSETQITHTIEMDTYGMGTLLWVFGVRSLHDALIEDAFDKIHNYFSDSKKETAWSLWGRFLRSRLN